jgi:GAF domain-containing protein
MQFAPTYSKEGERLEAVQKLGLLDNKKPDSRFDELTKMALVKLHAPISTLTILDNTREYYKSCQGLDATDGDRAISFCGHALLAQDLFIIPDCKKDIRFKDNPMVIGKPFIRFYAGMALLDYSTRLPIAVFCIKDTKPRTLSVNELDIFMLLAKRAEELLNGVSESGLTPLKS